GDHRGPGGRQHHRHSATRNRLSPCLRLRLVHPDHRVHPVSGSMAPVLEGVRVVDLSWGTAGAVATMLLADYGAEVIKVEPPDGDPFRAMPGYTVWNRGKQSVVLNLKDESGAARFADLVAGADVVIESFSPETLPKLGLEIEPLLVRHPRLIACSIT